MIFTPSDLVDRRKRSPEMVTDGSLTFSVAMVYNASASFGSIFSLFSALRPSVTKSSKAADSHHIHDRVHWQYHEHLQPVLLPPAAKPIHFRALDSFFQTRIFSRRWCSFTSFKERSMWPFCGSTFKVLYIQPSAPLWCDHGFTYPPGVPLQQ